MESIISPKGQVTVPKPLRDEFGLAEGTPVEFLPRESGILLKKHVTESHPVDRVFGILHLAKSVDTLLAEMRGPTRKRHR